MSDKIRTFFAVDIEDDEILSQIEKYKTELQKSIGPLKLVDKDLMHITLRFLGNITTNQAEELYRYMEKEINEEYIGNLEDGSFTCEIKGVGNFRKKVFFVDITEGTEELREIHKILEKKIRTMKGIKHDNRKYNPHITIARKKRRGTHRNEGQMSYPKLQHIYENFEFGSWKVKKIVLKKSDLTPKGPIYTNLKY